MARRTRRVAGRGVVTAAVLLLAASAAAGQTLVFRVGQHFPVSPEVRAGAWESVAGFQRTLAAGRTLAATEYPEERLAAAATYLAGLLDAGLLPEAAAALDALPEGERRVLLAGCVRQDGGDLRPAFALLLALAGDEAGAAGVVESLRPELTVDVRAGWRRPGPPSAAAASRAVLLVEALEAPSVDPFDLLVDLRAWAADEWEADHAHMAAVAAALDLAVRGGYAGLAANLLARRLPRLAACHQAGEEAHVEAWEAMAWCSEAFRRSTRSYLDSVLVGPLARARWGFDPPTGRMDRLAPPRGPSAGAPAPAPAVAQEAMAAALDHLVRVLPVDGGKLLVDAPRTLLGAWRPPVRAGVLDRGEARGPGSRFGSREALLIKVFELDHAGAQALVVWRRLNRWGALRLRRTASGWRVETLEQAMA